MPCPYCGATLAEGARLCTACGRLIAPRPAGGAAPAGPATSPGQLPPFGAGASYPPGSFPPSTDPYSRFFDVRALSPDTAAAYRRHRFHATFSVLLLILVHIVTFGFASPFLLARKYTFLPRIRRDDFSTGRAAGFLFIPFFSVYWVFVLCRRIVERLTLQTVLWGVPGAPSRGLATTVAIGWVVSAIPYLGLLCLMVMYFALWPVYLAQIQAVCNRLALAAAPAEAQPYMLSLERAMRLRWLGWIVLSPCLVSVLSGLLAIVVAPPAQMTETIVGLIVLVLIGGVGGALIYLGERGTGALEHDLASVAPWILAGYLRIDKNAAWTVAWIAIPGAIVFGVTGVVAMFAPPTGTTADDAWSSIAMSAALGVGTAYAVFRALQLRRQMAGLANEPPSPEDARPSAW
jgi:hypothetical protein